MVNENVTETFTFDKNQIEESRQHIIVSSLLLFIGICSNVLVLVSLLKTWKTGNRIYFFIFSLCIADILGIGVHQGINIGWHSTMIWSAGDTACKICMFFYLFGSILAHYILAAFNIDNAITVCTYKSTKATRILFLAVSIIVTVCVCAPQAFVYSVQHHPGNPQLTQCVRFGVLDSKMSRLLYVVVITVAVYWLPLLVIIVAVITSILTWWKKSKSPVHNETRNRDGSDMLSFGTDLAMVMTFNIAFFLCWTPIVLWGLLSITTHAVRALDNTVARRLSVALTFVSVVNGCLNPIIYGIFLFIRRRNPAAGL